MLLAVAPLTQALSTSHGLALDIRTSIDLIYPDLYPFPKVANISPFVPTWLEVIQGHVFTVAQKFLGIFKSWETHTGS